MSIFPPASRELRKTHYIQWKTKLYRNLPADIEEINLFDNLRQL